MAYITMITAPRDLTTDESQQLDTYLEAQVAANTTNDLVYQWVLNKTPQLVQGVRIWTTSASATGYQALLEGFSPPIPVMVY